MSDTKQTKTIGEHYVAAELARHRWAPAMTRDGLERTDILAVRTDGARRLVEVQVKTTVTPGWPRANWPLGEKNLQPSASGHEYYVMVAVLTDLTVPPRFFIVPRTHVAAATWISHQHWLTEPGIPAGKRNAPVAHSRVNLSTFAQYEDRWDLLDIDEADCPVLLPTDYRSYAQDSRVGLPPHHP